MFSFITAYFQINSRQNDYYFEQFYKIADINFPIILFLDSTLEDRVASLQTKYNNIKIILMDWSSLYINLGITSQHDLKETSTNPKDNVKYMILMNSKPYFLKLALEHTDMNTLCWIDFGIFKITDDVEQFKYNFSKIGYDPLDKVLIPGGFRKKALLDLADMRQVYWRFLGGIVVCPRNLVEIFYKKHIEELNKILIHNEITWEVNIWCNIEYNNPDLIQYFRADHNKTMFGFYDIKIILISMIKNEEKIIRRCIDSLSICSAYCINDTGSTDTTLSILKELESKNKPCKIYENTWKDFGTNRTISYNNAVEFCIDLGWDPNRTYGLLLDADMTLVVSPLFNSQLLTHNGYKMIQDGGSTEYYNIRFVKLNKSWKCIGATHEYWDGSDAGTIPKTNIYIEDIGDGGCKGDKFQRDMVLLEKGITEEPNNPRYHFYLAQTYKDLGKYKEAIAFYKKRITIGGWCEEIWYSHYMIAKCYYNLNNIHKAEAWANKAYEYRRGRVEPLYLLIKIFRINGDHYKAYHYYKLAKSINIGNDTLFIEKNISTYLLDYEYTILQYWVFPKDRLTGLYATLNYLNKYTQYENNVYANMDHYISGLPYTSLRNMEIQDYEEYTPSSSSMIEYHGDIILNIRYVNYRILPDGSYKILSTDGCVRTKNAVSYLDLKYNNLSFLKFLNTNLTDIEPKETKIKGLEDIRLFVFQEKIYYLAISKEYSYNDTIRIVLGIYDIESLTHINNHTLIPPEETYCEKNWIPINHNNEKILFIYKWHPLEIGELTDNYKLNITITHATPIIFKNYRGSTTLIKYENKLWCITHGVKYSTPRKYYHQFVTLEQGTYKPVQYSIPFYFNKYAIEYSIGFIIKDEEAIIIFSQNDRDTSILRIDMDIVKKYMIDV